jgi:hypothetical protein
MCDRGLQGASGTDRARDKSLFDLALNRIDTLLAKWWIGPR